MKAGLEAMKFGGIGDAAVRAKTGKGWKEWFKVLDAAGARRMNHTEIAAYLYKQRHCPGWWSQMVAVGYEQARGLRQKHQTPEGFQVSSSRTFAAPVRAAFAAWADFKRRARWLPHPAFTVRKATPEKSMRITWVDGKSHVDVYFYSRGKRKCGISVDHRKLAGAKAVERMRRYWAKALEQLQARLEAR